MRDWGAVLHAAAGFGVAAAATAVGFPGLLAVVLLTVAGWAREVWQHDLRLSVHQWGEALAWGVGGLAGWALVAWLR